MNKYKRFGTKLKQTVHFSNISKKPFPSTASKKYIMIEEFKDVIKGLKFIINEIKKTRTIERTRNKWNKKWDKKKVKYVRWWNKRYIRKSRCRFNNFSSKM